MNLTAIFILLKQKLHSLKLGFTNPADMILLFAIALLVGVYSCTTDRTGFTEDYDIDTDGDGILDSQEILNGTNKNNPCDPVQNAAYTSYDPLNILWGGADCDNDGIPNAEEVSNDTNPYINNTLDSDGDGILDAQEIQDGTDKDNPCDPFQAEGYNGFNSSNSIWAAADCDNDGITNGAEITASTDPYFDEIGGTDSDGDGIKDDIEITEGSDPNDPCDPVQLPGYGAYDPSNPNWAAADCDSDGVLNSDEIDGESDPYYDDRIYPIPEFLPTLSELKLFEGSLSDLKLNATVHEYSLSTQLFTDYSQKLRSISLPRGTQMLYNGDGLPLFPDNTILTKTFFYLFDERVPSLGKKIIETRILIKTNGVWTAGNYVWNDSQTEAYLDGGAHAVPISWIDMDGNNRNINYLVPPNSLCFQCHDYYNNPMPVGPKLRSLNFEHNGQNQIQYFIDKGLLQGVPAVSQITALPDWTDTNHSLDERSRAYLDMNCAHCHQPGGSYNLSYGDKFDLRYETSFAESKIYEERVAIQDRMNTQISNYFMPLIGTTVIHTEGVALIDAYIESLD